ncbi:MAG: bifunctional hydroxymethylpyrimidine kinase/phosphomethylpyrimidine kinase [Nitrospinae bacterium]|nr:bifunctional hydroxymethylpyrimidine kinase/phosphomethylpyrimidine kinase [Nitrospinota bacterium]
MKQRKEYFRALTIAGSDNSGGAGIQADLKTFSALGCYGMSVITALTAQNTQGVHSIQEVEAKFIEEQFETILEDIGVDAIKVGMLFNIPTIKVVAKCLRKIKDCPIVLDPVMFAKSGDRLLQEEAVVAIQKELFPLATVVTPNIPEAEAFLDYSIENSETMRQAVMDLCDKGPEAVVIKGGGLSNHSSDDCLFVKGSELLWLKQERIDTKNIHGTGCTFSSAIAAFLARFYKLEDAVTKAKLYLTQALKSGADKKLGQGQGPVMHFYNIWEK